MHDEGYLAALACGAHAYASSIAFWGSCANNYHTYDPPALRGWLTGSLRALQCMRPLLVGTWGVLQPLLGLM